MKAITIVALALLAGCSAAPTKVDADIAECSAQYQRMWNSTDYERVMRYRTMCMRTKGYTIVQD